jgi:cytosine/adenosine deaminase-related metal-dependent hydrolase
MQLFSSPSSSVHSKMLYIHATIITIDATRQIIEDGAIYVDNDTIADIGKTTILLQRYPHEKRYNLGGCIVVPGLVSTHIHTIQTLLRGTADNLAKETWLSERVRPLQRSMTNADAQVSVKLTIAEMLKSGTTSFLECLVCYLLGPTLGCGSISSLPARFTSSSLLMTSTNFVKRFKTVGSEPA